VCWTASSYEATWWGRVDPVPFGLIPSPLLDAELAALGHNPVDRAWNAEPVQANGRLKQQSGSQRRSCSERIPGGKRRLTAPRVEVGAVERTVGALDLGQRDPLICW
jgi:hypothetical protein